MKANEEIIASGFAFPEGLAERQRSIGKMLRAAKGPVLALPFRTGTEQERA